MAMKKVLYLCILVFAGSPLIAQVPEDAIRMSWNAPSGTARQQAIGGAMGSLGGEITSLYVNPAGLGFFKTSEFVLTPSFSISNGKSNYLGNFSSANGENRFNLGTTGFVFGSVGNRQSRWSNKAFSIAISRTANFNGRSFYQGINDYSSFSETFAEEFSQSGLPIDVVLYTAPLSLGTKLANYALLIDTLTVNGNTEVIGLPQRSAILHNTDAVLNQEKDIQTKGGITELALGYAANMDDRIYIGGSLGIPIVNYQRTSTLRESDASGDTDNDFNYASYREEYSSSGVGINAKLGVIFKPANQIRAGLSIHSPTLYGLREKTIGRMEVDLEGYPRDPGLIVADADSIYTQFGANIPEYRFDLVSPWKFLISGSYFFTESEDVSQQKGFVTADIEYVTHGSSRFSSADQTGDNEYFRMVNEGVKYAYKGAFNFRAGGELKFNTFMTRLGFAWYGKPYDDKELKASRMNISGGLGYRDKGIFIDLAYVYSINKDVDFPYRLADKANVFANVKNNNSNILLTLGFKF